MLRVIHDFIMKYDKSAITRILSKAKKSSTNLDMDRYVWIDLECTGLDKTSKILEVACIITTTNLNMVHEGINLVIHQPEVILNSMNAWCLIHHEKSGLTNESRESKITIEQADELVSEYIKKNTNDEGVRYLAGNSVHYDKRFIDQYMPFTNSLLHYRILDISAIKILCSHWYPDVYLTMPKKNSSHRAFSDILNSLKELKEYKKAIFKPSIF